jgi:ABC-type lipoprotein export system ATPase subunit
MTSIRVTDVRKSYRLGRQTVPALKGVNLRVNAAAIVGIVGPSGSGKTTLLNLIGCLDKPDEGTAHLGEIAHGSQEAALEGRAGLRRGSLHGPHDTTGSAAVQPDSV